MTNRNRLLAASLLPLLASFSLGACGNDSTDSDTMATGGVTAGAPPGSGSAGMGGAMGGAANPGPGMGGVGPANPTDSNVAGGGNPPPGATGDMMGPSGDMMGPSGDMMGPSGDMMGPSGDMMAPSGDMMAPSDDMMAPSDDMMAPSDDMMAPSDDMMAGGEDGGAGGEDPVDEVVVDGVNVQMGKTRQPIQGFGINTALMPGGSLPYDDLFGLDGPNAVGMSILRIGMNSNGSLTGQGISEARSRGAKIIGSTWSPPANCKSNNSTQNGGNLLESCYNSWATTIANFARDQNLYAMSIANESDFASCPGVPVCTVAYDTTVYTAKQMVAWVKVAGAKIREVAPDTLVIAPEASEWVHVWGNASGTGSIVSSHPHSSDPLDCGCYANAIDPAIEATCAQHCIDGDGYDYGHWLWADQDAWNSFDILGVHEYDSQIAFPWPEDVNNGVRNKEVWQTEMSGVRHWPEEGPSVDINNGIAVAGWIHSAMTVGEASAWLYWWYEAYYENDNEGLALTQNTNTIAKRYFTFGNYSKFVRPGFNAVEVAGADDPNVLISAYTGEGGQVVVVAINKGDSTEFPITITGGTAPGSMTPHVTSANDNLVAGNSVPVTDGVFTASLGGKTVTTFVGE